MVYQTRDAPRTSFESNAQVPRQRAALENVKRVAAARQPWRGGGRRSLFGNAGLAKALENGLKLGEVRRVV